MRFKLMYFTFCILIFWCCAEIIPGLFACPKNHTLNFFFPMLLPRECVWGLKFSIQVAGKWNLIGNVGQALLYNFFFWDRITFAGLSPSTREGVWL